MPNMSHCRFHNTLGDLRDCEEAMDNGDVLGADEAKARDQLLRVCWRIAMNYCDEDGNPEAQALKG